MSPAITSPYEGLDARQFWKTGVEACSALNIESIFKPKFGIDRTLRFATAGSCFAQHIARHLRTNGFDVIDTEPAPAGMSPTNAARFGYGLFSARFGNIYYSRQLLQLLREVQDDLRPEDPVWRRGDRFFDAFRPSVEPEGLSSAEEVLAHRRRHLASVRQMFAEAQVFIFTLGLTEAWLHRGSGTVYPTAPGTVAGRYDPSTYEFRNFTYPEILADMEEVRERLRAVNPSIRMLLTVSPVPLTATASDQHVLVATMHSKSILRAVVGSLHQRYDDVDYFPSYELVAGHQARAMFFKPNLRTVEDEGVRVVMRHFFRAHGIETGAGVPPPAEAAERASQTAEGKATGDTDDVQCDDALLEAFVK